MDHGGIGSKRSKKLAGGVGSGQEVFKTHWSGRVATGGFQISRVGPGHPDTILPTRRDPTRESPEKKLECNTTND